MKTKKIINILNQNSILCQNQSEPNVGFVFESWLLDIRECHWKLIAVKCNSWIRMKVSDAGLPCKRVQKGHAQSGTHWYSIFVSCPFKLSPPPSSAFALIQEATQVPFF